MKNYIYFLKKEQPANILVVWCVQIFFDNNYIKSATNSQVKRILENLLWTLSQH